MKEMDFKEDDLNIFKRIYSFTKIVNGYINLILISLVLFFYALSFFLNYHTIPDYCKLSENGNYKAFVWDLIRSTLSFSGLILTLVTLSYNFYIKSTKRQTLEFTLKNKYFRLLNSGFIVTILIQLIAYCSFNKTNHDSTLTSVYFVFFLTFVYLISQLPIAFFGLRYSNSFEKILSITNAISYEDVKHIIPPGAYKNIDITEIEGNNMMLIKDIGQNAIRESDWILPQKIVSEIFKLIPASKEKECPIIDTHGSIISFLWLCNHFHRAAIKAGDHITVNIIASNIFQVYVFLSEKKIYDREIYENVDDYQKDFFFDIVQSRDFRNIRKHFIRDYIDVMIMCLQSFNHTDEELPTDQFLYDHRAEMKSYNKDLNSIWHYASDLQFRFLIEVLEFCIEQKDTLVYARFNFQIGSLLSRVSSLDNLTDYQRKSYILEILRSLSNLQTLCLKENLYDEIWLITHIEMENWAKHKWRELYRYGFMIQSSTLRKLFRSSMPYWYQLSDFFMLGKSIRHRSPIEIDIKKEIAKRTLEIGLGFSGLRDDALFKYYIQSEIKSYFESFIKIDTDLKELVEEFSGDVAKAIEGFDENNVPEGYYW